MTSANEIQLLWHNSPIYMLTMSGDSITDDLVKNCINQYIQYYKNVTEQVFDFVPFAIIECDGIKNPDFIKFPGYIHKTVIILFKDKKNNDVLRFEQYKQPADKKALLNLSDNSIFISNLQYINTVRIKFINMCLNLSSNNIKNNISEYADLCSRLFCRIGSVKDCN